MKTILPETSRAKGDEVRQEQVVKKQKEYKMVGKMRKTPGHTLFEFNKKTKEIKPAAINRECRVDFGTGKPIYKTKTDIHEDCFYVQALNIKNAEKKLRKLGIL
jgi:hypothetical protein